MAEKKPWDHLRDGINDLWNSFFGASDDNDLSLFCKNRSDERIPESFLEKFISKLEEDKWTLSEDPDYKTPQELMDKVFQATKKKMMEKLRKQNKKKVAQDEKKEEIVQQEEAIVPVEVVEEEEEVVLTEEQLKLNLEVKRKRREEWAKLKKIQSQERAEKTRIYQRDLTMANRTLSMNNELIGCDKEAQRQKGCPSDADVGKWLTKAVDRRVVVLKFKLCWSACPTRLPKSLYSCETLEELTLSHKILVDFPSSACLPSLLTLELFYVVYKDEASLVRLLSSCPVLELLDVKRNKNHDNTLV
ncbi:unnamed protein product [Arabidopsis arenosa]|uniref:F-box/LRR-repeat protein 15/At3g58940/PEG3-like LRR domain-containing protein n=1 Tax=Arabidopsis arenosa TaxID=38785 RepID=A0A8S2AQ62_ARAAE|nr:unnamed protein product [Arabidopsis arenosa]